MIHFGSAQSPKVKAEAPRAFNLFALASKASAKSFLRWRGEAQFQKIDGLSPSSATIFIMFSCFCLGFKKIKVPFPQKKLGHPSQPAPAISEVRGVGIGLALRNHSEVVDIEGLGRLRSVKAQILRIWCCLGTCGVS